MNWPDWMLYKVPAMDTDGFATGRLNALRDGARQVLAAVSGVALLGPPDGVVWRGQADATWRLESRASRLGFTADEIADHERVMLREARRLGIDNAQRMGDWEILARFRHHGAATRLIDCTSDPFIALWFLCEDDSEGAADADGVLLAIQRSVFKPIDSPYEPGNYERMFTKPPAPLIYSTPPIDPRIAAQRGLFVLHTHPLDRNESVESELGVLSIPSAAWGRDHRSRLTTLCGTQDMASERGRPQFRFPDLIGVVVPSAVKPLILEMLKKNFGFTRSSVFPDFAGLGKLYSAR